MKTTKPGIKNWIASLIKKLMECLSYVKINFGFVIDTDICRQLNFDHKN